MEIAACTKVACVVDSVAGQDVRHIAVGEAPGYIKVAAVGLVGVPSHCQVHKGLVSAVSVVEAVKVVRCHIWSYYSSEGEDVHFGGLVLAGHADYLWTPVAQERVVEEQHYLAVVGRTMNGNVHHSLALEGDVVVEFVLQSLGVLMLVGLPQEGGGVLEEAPELVEDGEGHFAVVEILLGALWQRPPEELPKSPRCWTSADTHVSMCYHSCCIPGYHSRPRILPTPLGMDGRPSLEDQHVDQALQPYHQ